MNHIPCQERKFLFELAPWYESQYETQLRWLKHFLERLGKECTTTVWQKAFSDYDDKLLMELMAGEWIEMTNSSSSDIDARITKLIPEFFPVSVEGVSGDEAKQLIEMTPPIYQIRKGLPSLTVYQEMTAYDALHLRFDVIAALVESLVELLGKQGELIAYDLILEYRITAGGERTGNVEEFISEAQAEPDEPNLFSAGLEDEIMHSSERELVVHVRECEWARYFQERHPQVGYLIACSTDEAAYKAFNKNLRLQRTTTLMEGGEFCDFRICAVKEGTLTS